MRRYTWAALALALAAGLAGCRRGDGLVRATGTLEVEELDAAPLQAARVERVWVEEGDTVQAGDTLATLVQAATQGQVGQSEAQLEVAEARLREVEAGPRDAEVARARAELRVREAEATRAARELERIRALEQAGALSRQALDDATAASRVAAGQRDAVRAGLRVLEEGSRAEEVAAARAQVEGARSAVRTSRATAGELVLVAAVGGVVVGRHARAGEVVPAGQPVVTLGETTKPWTRVYVGEDVLPLVRVGQEVTGRLDAFPDRPFRGRVASVADRAEFTPRVALTEEERRDLLFGVKVEFEDGTGMLKAGLPVTVELPRPREAAPR